MNTSTPETPTTDPIDAVFVIGTGSKNNNEELKYALRNLDTNCPFIRNVYIVGECPSWVSTSIVKHINWPDRFSHAKDANIIDKLKRACEEPGIAERILFCSDDQFQTRKCTWEDFKPRWLRQYQETDPWYESKKRIWHSRLRKTLERERVRRLASGLDPEHIFYYQPHIWMPIDRQSFIEYANWSDYQTRDDTIIASGYFNYIDADGEANNDHTFISVNQSWASITTHVAYSDATFKSAMWYLTKVFPNPSRFETGYIKGSASEVIIGGHQLGTSTPNSRSDVAIIKDFIAKVWEEPAWKSLQEEINEAEALREINFVGWRRVWNDIIKRWATITERGKLILPVTAPKSDSAKEIIEAFKSEYPTKEPLVPAETIVQESRKGCSSCAARRRKALLERQQKEAARATEVIKDKHENSDNAPAETTGTIEKTKQASAILEEAEVQKDSSIQVDACLDCAIDHLTIAIAYLGSNASRPTPIELSLAKGEIYVAAQYMLTLGYTPEYDKCLQALDSLYTEESIFTVATFKQVLKQLLSKG